MFSKAATIEAELRGPWQKRPKLHAAHQIIRIPSPELWDTGWATLRGHVTEHIRYSRLDLQLLEDGWTATVSGGDDPAENDGYGPQTWTADTFDDLFNAVDQWDIPLKIDAGNRIDTMDELAELLIDDDPRWNPLIEFGLPER